MNKRPITIRRGSFVCTLYDVGNFTELPLANVRKLWKIMFSADDENLETIEVIRAWLPTAITDAENLVTQKQNARRAIAGAVEIARQTVAAFGSMATKEQKETLQTARRTLKYIEKELRITRAAHGKAQKLQAIFTEYDQKLRR